MFNIEKFSKLLLGLVFICMTLTTLEVIGQNEPKWERDLQKVDILIEKGKFDKAKKILSQLISEGVKAPEVILKDEVCNISLGGQPDCARLMGAINAGAKMSEKELYFYGCIK